MESKAMSTANAELNARTSPAWPNLARSIESRVQDANEHFFPVLGCFLSGANVEFNARHAMQQPDNPARQPLRVGHAVTGQSLAQIARLADIQHALGRTAHEIHARPRRERTEEIRPQPLDQWLGWQEKPELPGITTNSRRTSRAKCSRFAQSTLA